MKNLNLTSVRNLIRNSIWSKTRTLTQNLCCGFVWDLVQISVHAPVWDSISSSIRDHIRILIEES